MKLNVREFPEIPMFTDKKDARGAMAQLGGAGHSAPCRQRRAHTDRPQGNSKGGGGQQVGPQPGSALGR